MLTLNVEKRDTSIKLEKLRQGGRVPAVYYGHKVESTPISLEKGQIEKIWKEAGESTVVNLVGGGINVEVLIHEMSFHPVNSEPIHVDFYVFEKGHKIEVDIPINFSGVSPAVEDLGGSLVKVMHELKVSAVPKDLPHTIEVDISSLVDFDSNIFARDIKLPPGVLLVEKPDDVVVSVTEPKEEVETAPIDISAVEVEKKGKEKTSPEESTGEKDK